ncbi:DUF5615 family PIN-like protein [Pseudonocardia sp. CA-107938]|uniref:DUF5615 family PIN-like protein n=1 Tax=Pseudonocardia sp. CA-107938 TaxID=3240021 RepID=UPI003D944A0E
MSRRSAAYASPSPLRLLLDNNLSSRLVNVLTREGWDVIHVSDLGLRAATDAVVLRAA